MDKYKEIYRELVPKNTGVEVVLKKISGELKDNGYDMGIQHSNLICFNGPHSRPCVGCFEVVEQIYGPAVLITADINIPEGKNLAGLLEKLDISQL